MVKNQKPQKKYECEYCRKMFSIKSARNNHKNTHTEHFFSESSLISVNLVQDFPAEDKSDASLDTAFSYLEHFLKANKQGYRVQNIEKESVQEMEVDTYSEPEENENVEEMEIEEENGQDKGVQGEKKECAQERKEERTRDNNYNDTYDYGNSNNNDNGDSNDNDTSNDNDDNDSNNYGESDNYDDNNQV